LLLDPQIRSLVVIPIVLITLLVLVGKHYIVKLMAPKVTTVVQIAESQALTRTRMLRANCRFLPEQAFQMRRSFYVKPETGYLITNKRDEEPPNPMSDPSQMQNMMMGQSINMVPMVVIGGIIHAVFAGFVTIRVPFPLTMRFKGMLQRGIELSTLSSSWVSSASFYFIVYSGLRGLITLFLGANPDFDEMKMMQQQMNPGMGAPPNPGKAFDGEKEMLMTCKHKWAMDTVEPDFLAKQTSAKSKSV